MAWQLDGRHNYNACRVKCIGVIIVTSILGLLFTANNILIYRAADTVYIA